MCTCDLRLLLCFNIRFKQSTVVCELTGMCSLSVAEYGVLIIE